MCVRVRARERERVEETSCGWFLYIDDACKTNISVEGDCQAALDLSVFFVSGSLEAARSWLVFSSMIYFTMYTCYGLVFA